MAYLTPDKTVMVKTITINVPQELTHILTGHFNLLLNDWWWEQFGDMTIQEAEQAIEAILTQWESQI